MNKSVLLISMVVFFAFITIGCNGASLSDPLGPVIPHEVTGGTDENTPGSYAVDVIESQREIPVLPVEDPDWVPVFDSLTGERICIDNGCMTIDIAEPYSNETNIVTFNVAFFNPNSDEEEYLNVYMVIDDLANGVSPVNPDDYYRAPKETVQYPYYKFSQDNSDEPDVLKSYVYFEREISFEVEPQADFYVHYELYAVLDTQDLNYVIGIDAPVHEGNEGEEGEGREGDGYNPIGQTQSGQAKPKPAP